MNVYVGGSSALLLYKFTRKFLVCNIHKHTGGGGGKTLIVFSEATFSPKECIVAAYCHVSELLMIKEREIKYK